MGFRFRKSINLGGGFRINLSKSGVGYSWGVKGYRITKTAKGTVRRTTSIPGTGISFVEETGSNKNRNRPPPAIDNNHYDTQDISNSVTDSTVSDGLKKIIEAARLAIGVNRFTTIGLWVSLFLCFLQPLFAIWLVIFIGLKIYVKKAAIVDLNYSIDSNYAKYIAQYMDPMIKVTKSEKVWRIMQSSKAIDKKYTGGASTSVNRVACHASQKPPFPFKSNIPVATFKTGNESLIFLPDKLFIVQGNKIGALSYSDITTSSHTTQFIEEGSVPRDSEIVGHTWKYVNKSGGPDKRFKNNRELPICLYGEIELRSISGLNTVIMFSNVRLQ